MTDDRLPDHLPYEPPVRRDGPSMYALAADMIDEILRGIRSVIDDRAPGAEVTDDDVWRINESLGTVGKIAANLALAAATAERNVGEPHPIEAPASPARVAASIENAEARERRRAAWRKVLNPPSVAGEA